MYLTSLLFSMVLLLCNAKDPAEQLNVMQIVKYKMLFSSFDINHDGVITPEELENKMEMIQKKQNDPEAMMMEAAGVDGDDKGTIHCLPMLQMKMKIKALALKAKQLMKKITRPKDPIVYKEADDLANMMEEAFHLATMMEAAGVGTLDYPEFLNMIAIRKIFLRHKNAYSTISTEALKVVLQELGDKAEDEYVKYIINISGGDDDLEFPQFLRMMISRKRFHEIVTDRKGFLSAEKLEDFMNKLNLTLTKKDVKEMIGVASESSEVNDSLDFSGFLMWMEVLKIFQEIDTDGNGKINITELQKNNPEMTVENLKDMPFDKDDQLNFKDFFLMGFKGNEDEEN